jgi:hypothetical protein
MEILRIDGFTAGDDLQIERDVTDVPTGQTVAQAWLAIKRKASDLDSAAVLLKPITTSVVPANGYITNPSAGSAVLLFVLSGTETALLTEGVSYYYAIKVKTDQLIKKTIERGAISAGRNLIQAG